METVIPLWNFGAAVTDEAVKREQLKTFQILINSLNEGRKVWRYYYDCYEFIIKYHLLRLLRHLPFQSNPFLNSCPTHIPFQNTLAGISKLLDMSEDLIDILVKKELVEWQRRQQKACIGALDSVCLNQLENWYVDVNINWFLLFCILCCKWLLYPLLLLLDLSATAHLAPPSQMCR